MNIKHVVVGPVYTNCYIASGRAGEAVIIDPGYAQHKIAALLESEGLAPKAILLTHGHFDHIMAIHELKEMYGELPVYASKDEVALLSNPTANLSPTVRKNYVVTPDFEVADGDIIELAGLSFEVISTPGHTAGCICFYVREENVLFSGDTLFEGTVGRTDLPTSSPAAMRASIAKLMKKLPDETEVYPGHGGSTTIGYEKAGSPFYDGDDFLAD